jgi:hypothetical protein
MKLEQQFNTRISSLVDTYQGAVPLSRLLLEAARLQSDPLPELSLERDEQGQTFIHLLFDDGSTCTLSVTEEM